MPHRPSELNVDSLASVIAGEFRGRSQTPPSQAMLIQLAQLGKSWLVEVTGDRDIPASGQLTTLAANLVTAWISPDDLPADPGWRYLGVLVQQLKSGGGPALESARRRLKAAPKLKERAVPVDPTMVHALTPIVHEAFRAQGKDVPDPATTLAIATDLRHRLEGHVEKSRPAVRRRAVRRRPRRGGK
jgi:hypothetical protein